MNYCFLYDCIRYYATNFTHYSMSINIHDTAEILYVVHGKCAVFIYNDKNEKTEYNLKERQYIFVDRRVPHELSVKKDTYARILHLELKKIPPRNYISFENYINDVKNLELFLKDEGIVFRGEDEKETLQKIIMLLHYNLDMKKKELSVNSIACDLLVAQFFIELAVQKSMAENNGGKKNAQNVYINKSIAYIDENYASDIKIKNIADSIHISSAHLQRIFKNETGRTLIEYINDVRVEKAKLLLTISKLTILDIAVSVGFNSRQHFSYAFSSIAGCSPNEYRKKNRI